MTNYEEISKQAEQDLNSQSAKTGENRPETYTEAGVNSYVENKFPSAKVVTGDELSTNAGYNKRIPPSEGGELDDRGRQARGELYEGAGGATEKAQPEGGQNDNDVVPARVPKVPQLGSVNDIATQGAEASVSNVGTNPPGPGGSQYKGEDYYVPETVPDSITAEGNIPPESVTQSSREAEYPDREA